MAPAHVQSVAVYVEASGTVASVATTTATTAGNLLIAAVYHDLSTQTAVSDTAGNSWTEVVNLFDGTYNQRLHVYAAYNIAGGTTTVTSTLVSAATCHSILVAEYSGVATTSPLDGTWQGQSGTGTANGTDSVTSGVMTTTLAGDLVLGVLGRLRGDYAAGTGFTFRVRAMAAINHGLGLEDRVQPAAGSIAATWTPVNADTYQAAVLAFKAASVAPPASAPVFVSGTSVAGASGSNCALPVPASAAAGDVMVVGMYVERAGVVVSPPDGTWTECAHESSTLTAGKEHDQVWFWKRLTGADSGSYTFSWSSGATWREGWCARVTGCISTGSPWDGALATADEGGAQSTAAPAVSCTTTIANTLLIYGATNWNGGAWTPASGMTEQYDNSGDLTLDVQTWTGPGSTGSKSAACVSSSATTAVLGALKAAPSSGSTPVAWLYHVTQG